MNRFRLAPTGDGSNRGRVARAFSVLEVLFAVIVLGLGLLGLAAVFPSVIQQQRQANLVIEAGAVAATINGLIEPTDGVLSDLNRQRDVKFTDDGMGNLGVPVGFGFDANVAPEYVIDERPDSLRSFSYLWELDWTWSRELFEFVPNRLPDLVEQQTPPRGVDLEQYLLDGGIRFSRRDPQFRTVLQPDALVARQGPDIAVTGRFVPPAIPSASGELPDPEYIWDFVARRNAATDIEIAVFVREIDPEIERIANRRRRANSSFSLANLLTGFNPDGTALPPEEWLLPLAYDYQERRPVPGGVAFQDAQTNGVAYSVPLGAAARVLTVNERYRESMENFDVTDENVGRFIEVNIGGQLPTLYGAADSTDNRAPRGPDDLDYLAQVGQMFVDNLGTVRTVVEVYREPLDGSLISIEIDPPYSTGAISEQRRSPGTAANQPGVRNASIGGFNLNPFTAELRQVVFTPQIPISLTVRSVAR